MTDVDAFLEGFRFGAPRSPAPLPAAVAARARAAADADADADGKIIVPGISSFPRDDDDGDDGDDWHVSESENGSERGDDDDDGGDDDDDARKRARDDDDDDDAKNAANIAVGGTPSDDAVVAKRPKKPPGDDDARVAPLETYADVVDHEREGRGASRGPAGDELKRFFLPRGHPARAQLSPRAPPPPRWRETLDAILASRRGRRARVDAFHDFLLSLSAEPEPSFQALVATLLSVQCRDGVALRAMTRLRDALGGQCVVAAVTAATRETIEDAVSCCNYKRTKARYVKEVAAAIRAKHRGVVPRTVVELKTLPGVGPKIAHLVASVAFGEASGVVVDAHVRRVASRLGWTTDAESRSAEATRARMEEWLPREEWERATLALIAHGQETCDARKPRCGECAVANACPSAGTFDGVRAAPKVAGKLIDVEDLAL